MVQVATAIIDRRKIQRYYQDRIICREREQGPRMSMPGPLPSPQPPHDRDLLQNSGLLENLRRESLPVIVTTN